MAMIHHPPETEVSIADKAEDEGRLITLANDDNFIRRYVI